MPWRCHLPRSKSSRATWKKKPRNVDHAHGLSISKGRIFICHKQNTLKHGASPCPYRTLCAQLLSDSSLKPPARTPPTRSKPWPCGASQSSCCWYVEPSAQDINPSGCGDMDLATHVLLLAWRLLRRHGREEKRHRHGKRRSWFHAKLALPKQARQAKRTSKRERILSGSLPRPVW